MVIKHLHYLFLACAFFAALTLPHPAKAQSFTLNSAGFSLQQNELLPPISLRGYGKVAADNALYVKLIPAAVSVF